ncbi:hypothetical protein LV84_00301 [Algoriphagus ratkowskyi]|uniref:Uncharacterized protein n=1 Tax=Algoriphagus ratkowskyi TaxID=57028 RepID=A0A2W7RKF8_9BACT|nr:hypothetical protein LV84_00301 [Algoriphagus ratkowskyi]
MIIRIEGSKLSFMASPVERPPNRYWETEDRRAGYANVNHILIHFLPFAGANVDKHKKNRLNFFKILESKNFFTEK